jgi:uncharacterized protein YlxW (UPF0749 family)
MDPMSAPSDPTASAPTAPTPAAASSVAASAVAASSVAASPAPAVDESMRLLRDVMEHPLDPAYATAARARSQGARPGRGAVVLTVLIAVLCGWIVARGVSELRRPEPGQAAGRATLEREIQRRTAAADVRQHQIQQLRAEIAAAQETQLTSQGDSVLADRVQQLGLLTGELPVNGPGLEFSISDARPADTQGAAVDPRAASAADEGRVLDRDLQLVVNGLWGAGAEAIAINGRRLTSLSAIRSAGQAILVDFRPLVPPYRIQAIGDASGLQTGFSSSPAGEYLQSLRDNFGVQVSITSAKELRLPAAGAFQLRKAGAVPSATASTSASGVTSSSAASAAPAAATVSPRSTGTPGPSGTSSSTEVLP